MKNKIQSISLVAALLLVLSISSAQAQNADRNFGLGLIIGEPTGVSFKSWTSSSTAIDGAVAWSFDGDEQVRLHADYLWHNDDLFAGDVDSGQILLYYGIGARALFQDDNSDDDVLFGARVPVGLNYLFENNPLGLFFEVAPIVNLIPSTDLDFDAAIGARFYF